jgi:hypothetical protein
VPFEITTPEEAAAWISGGLSYTIREGTNAFDITFTGTDRTLVPQILNQAAVQLRRDGTERMREIADRKVQYITIQKLDADSQSQAKLREMQRFKEVEQITDLSSEEASIIASIQDAEKERQRLLVQISTIQESAKADTIGLDGLNRLAAVDGIAQNAALEFQIQNIL